MRRGRKSSLVRLEKRRILVRLEKGRILYLPFPHRKYCLSGQKNVKANKVLSHCALSLGQFPEQHHILSMGSCVYVGLQLAQRYINIPDDNKYSY